MIRRIAGTALLAAGFMQPLAMAAECEDLELESLLHASAITPPGEVRFREERHSPIFKEPMVLTGTLEYLEPGVLRKTVEEPFQERYTVRPDGIIIEKNGETRELPARQSELIGGFLSGLEALLSGNEEQLARHFEPCLTGSLDNWNLQLQPKGQRLSRHLQGMQVRGVDGTLRDIRVDLGDEEWQLIELLPPADSPEG